jgi:Helix-turn-helix domain
LRQQAIRLREQGKRFVDIAAYLEVNRNTASSWWSQYQELGEAALYQQKRGNKLGEGRILSPDWELIEDDGWFLVDEADVDGELVLAQATLLDALDRNIEIMIHPKFTGCCPECGAEFDRRQPSPVYWDCDRCGWMDDTI